MNRKEQEHRTCKSSPLTTQMLHYTPSSFTSRASHTVMAVPPVCAGIALALYLAAATVTPIIILYWAAVLSVPGTFLFGRRFPIWWAISLTVTLALLWPVTHAAFAWTAWSI